MLLKFGVGLLVALAAGAAELSVGEGVVAAGKPADLSVKLAGGTDAPTAIQFDVEYDAAQLDIGIEAGPVAREAGKNMRTAKLQAGRQRVLIFGFNRTIIADGVLAILHVSYKGQETGKTFPIHLTGAAGTNENAEHVAVSAKDGSVRVEIGRNGQ